MTLRKGRCRRSVANFKDGADKACHWGIYALQHQVKLLGVTSCVCAISRSHVHVYVSLSDVPGYASRSRSFGIIIKRS